MYRRGRRRYRQRRRDVLFSFDLLNICARYNFLSLSHICKSVCTIFYFVAFFPNQNGAKRMNNLHMYAYSMCVQPIQIISNEDLCIDNACYKLQVGLASTQ